MPKRLTLEQIKFEFENKGYTLLTNFYKNSKQSFEFLCPSNHKGSMRIDHLRKGIKCPCCSGTKKLTLDFVKESFNKENYTLLSNEYINSKNKLDYICNKGHKGSTDWNNWSQGTRCMDCFGTKKKTIENITPSFNQVGYKLISEEYINKSSILDLICTNGHEYKVSWDNWNSKNSRCPKCSLTGVSLDELSLVNYIKELGFNVTTNDRTLIAPYELDIVLLSENIAIEYCGLYWHSDSMGKNRTYHLNKLELCKIKGFRLITIFEDEWISKRELVKSRLSNILKCNKGIKLYARQCEIKEISFKDAKQFIDEHHIQGNSIASIRLGLFHVNKLVAIATFSKPSISKGSVGEFNNVWELSRYCMHKNFTIPGAASKLLTYFENNYEWTTIFSYADLRWSFGDLYYKLNFSYERQTKPNYWYFKNNKVRLHRYGLRKDKNDLKNITEWEIRKSQNWNRIWDCGNLKFSKVNNLKEKDHC